MAVLLSDVLAFARTQAQTDSNGITDANGIIFANEALSDFRRRLVDTGVDAGTVTEFVQEGTVGTGIYTYPTNPSVLFLKTIELNYVNTTPADKVTATQLDVSNLPANKSVGWIRANASPSSPYYDDRGDRYEIFPTPTAAHNVTSIATLFYFAKPNDYTAVANSIAYPETLDYRILGWRIASNYLYSLGKVEEGSIVNQRYEERVKQLIATLSRGSQQPIQATPIQDSGWGY